MGKVAMRITNLVKVGLSAFCLILLATTVGAETLSPLTNGAPQTVAELWAGFDPQAEPLDTEILHTWVEDGVSLSVVRYRVGIFDGEKAMVAGVYGYPTGQTNLPALVNIHGGGQYADYKSCLSNAKRGYATLTVAWAGRISAPGYTVTPAKVQLFWDDATNDPNYKVTTDWAGLEGYHAPSRWDNNVTGIEPSAWTYDDVDSPRNSGWFLWTMAARRGLTFLEQQPEVDGTRLGVYGHSMGGKLTVMTAGSDDRVKAAAPSCGGVSDRFSSPLYNATIGDSNYLANITCPIFFLNPANDFHAAVEDVVFAVDQIGTSDWRVCSAPHHNHQDTAEYEVATQIWMDRHLKGGMVVPNSPEVAATLNPGSGVPSVTVTVDTNRAVQSVDVFYTQMGEDAGEQQPYQILPYRHWHYSAVQGSGDTWMADVPVLSTNEPLWVYANVKYALDAPIDGAGYYYAYYTANGFVLSTPLTMVTSAELQAAGVAETLSVTNLIEDFQGDWEKEWFNVSDDTNEWRIYTHKVNDPLYEPPVFSKLAFEVRSAQANTLAVRMADSVASVELPGGTNWQEVVLFPMDFRTGDGATWAYDWDGAQELRLNKYEAVTKNGQTLALGNLTWSGTAPEFSNLRWEPGTQAEYDAFRDNKLLDLPYEDGGMYLTFGAAESVVSLGNFFGTNTWFYGEPLVVGGVTNSRGLSVHAASEMVYFLGSQFINFTATALAGTSPLCSIKMQVYLDNVLAFDSGELTMNEIADIDLDVSNVSEMRLVVIDSGDGTNGDHGSWVDAHLTPLNPQAAVIYLEDFEDSPAGSIAVGTSAFNLNWTGADFTTANGLTLDVLTPNGTYANANNNLPAGNYVGGRFVGTLGRNGSAFVDTGLTFSEGDEYELSFLHYASKNAPIGGRGITLEIYDVDTSAVYTSQVFAAVNSHDGSITRTVGYTATAAADGNNIGLRLIADNINHTNAVTGADENNFYSAAVDNITLGVFAAPGTTNTVPPAATFAPWQDGDWSVAGAPGTWGSNEGGSWGWATRMPGGNPADTVVINISKTVNLDVDAGIGSLQIQNTTNYATLNLNTAGRTLTVNGSTTVGFASGEPGVMNVTAGEIDAKGDVIVNPTGLIDIDGGTFGRQDSSGVNNSLAFTGGGLIKLQSGAFSILNGGATNLANLNGINVEVSGGTLTFENQTWLGQTAPTEFKVVGDGATISFLALNQQSHTPNGTFNFVLNQTGVSPVEVSSWMFLDTASVVVDGSAYNPANGTNIVLFDAASINGALDTNNLTVTGLGIEGVDWELYQDAGAGNVGIYINYEAVQPSSTSSTDEMAYVAEVSAADLLHGLTAAASGFITPASAMNDGVHGLSYNTTNVIQGTYTADGATAEFVLGTGANGAGYDITSIHSIAAWNSAAFGNQVWTVDVKPVNGSWQLLGTVDYQPLAAEGATKVVLADASGVLAANIERIRFTANGAFVWREVDVFGVPSIAPPDSTPPTVSSLSPDTPVVGLERSNIAVGTKLVAGFSEAVQLGSGNITIVNLDTLAETVISLPSTQVSIDPIDQTLLVIEPTADLLENTRYAVKIGSAVVEDLAGNHFAGIGDNSTWTFKTAHSPMKIFCIGDSITVGYTDDLIATPFNFGYRGHLYQLLENARYVFQYVGDSTQPWGGQFGLDPTIGGTYKPAFDLRDLDQDYHQGGEGASIGAIQTWFQNPVVDPDLILLMIGINSIQTGVTANAVCNNISNLVDTIVTEKPGAHLIVAQISPYSGDYTTWPYNEGKNQVLHDYNVYIRDTLVPNYAASGHKVSTVDMYSMFLVDSNNYESAVATGRHSNGYNHPWNNAVDGAGYDTMAQQWFNAIEALNLNAVSAEKAKVFLLGGQSNMNGLGAVADLAPPYDAVQTNVAFWNNGAWTNLAPGFGNSINEFGPEVGFGHAVKQALPDEDFYLVKYAVNGTALYNDWAPPAGPQYLGFMNTARAAVAQLEADKLDYEIAGMLWLQGESDAAEGQGAAYETNLRNFIADMRAQFGNPDLPFYMARVREFYGTPEQAGLVRTAQVAVAESTANVEWFDTDAYNPLIGGGHYNAEGEINIGIDYAFLYLTNGLAGTFPGWVVGQGMDGSAGKETGFLDDPDGDGLANGVEAWFGTDPGTAGTGLSGIQSDGTTTTFQHPLNASPVSGLHGFYQWSLDLFDWYAADGIDSPGSGQTVSVAAAANGATATATATSSEPLSNLFLRATVILD